MKTLEVDRQITSSLTGEQREFKIAGTGKAFRTLIDGLYQNKVLAIVRELSSNAVDSHIAAGHTRNFEIKLPTVFDPEFWIRDYGGSMDEDFVMNLYSTIFYSSKDDNDEEVGMFGLGSKSPFCYTDSFTVSTFRGGERKDFLCFINDDDIPSITKTFDGVTDEEDGTRVSFAAHARSMGEFANAGLIVSLANEIKPTFVASSIIAPRGSTDLLGAVTYERPEGLDGGLYLNQGGVLYKVPQHPCSEMLRSIYSWNHLSSHIIVIRVPIGTFNVTPSREAIALDEPSQKNIRRFGETLIEEYRNRIKQIADDMGGSRVAISKAMKASGSLNSSTLGVKSYFENKYDLKLDTTQIYFKPDHILHGRVGTKNGPYQVWSKEHPGQNTQHDKLEDAVPGLPYFYSGKTLYGVESMVAHKAENATLWVGMERKIPRMALRMRQESKQCYDKALFCFTEDMPRLVRLMDLRGDQVRSISELPEVTVAKPSQIVAPTLDSPTQLWIPRTRNHYRTEILGHEYSYNYLAAVVSLLQVYDTFFGTAYALDWADLTFKDVSFSEARKMPKDQSIDHWVNSRVDWAKLAAEVAPMWDQARVAYTGYHTEEQLIKNFIKSAGYEDGDVSEFVIAAIKLLKQKPKASGFSMIVANHRYLTKFVPLRDEVAKIKVPTKKEHDKILTAELQQALGLHSLLKHKTRDALVESFNDTYGKLGN